MPIQTPTLRPSVSIRRAREMVGVSRRTLYNWMDAGKVEFTYTAGGCRRVYVDTLFRRSKPAPKPAAVGAQCPA